jgi:hypothetical protein
MFSHGHPYIPGVRIAGVNPATPATSHTGTLDAFNMIRPTAQLHALRPTALHHDGEFADRVRQHGKSVGAGHAMAGMDAAERTADGFRRSLRGGGDGRPALDVHVDARGYAPHGLHAHGAEGLMSASRGPQVRGFSRGTAPIFVSDSGYAYCNIAQMMSLTRSSV